MSHINRIDRQPLFQLVPDAGDRITFEPRQHDDGDWSIGILTEAEYSDEGPYRQIADVPLAVLLALSEQLRQLSGINEPTVQRQVV